MCHKTKPNQTKAKKLANLNSRQAITFTFGLNLFWKVWPTFISTGSYSKIMALALTNLRKTNKKNENKS